MDDHRINEHGYTVDSDLDNSHSHLDCDSGILVGTADSKDVIVDS